MDGNWSILGLEDSGEAERLSRDHAAVRTFLERYTGKQRSDSKGWLDYFTSDGFLEVAWERPYAAALLEQVVQLEEKYPPSREFLNWLSVAYQFTMNKDVYRNPDGSERTEYRFQIHLGAEFDGQELIFEVAARGPAQKQKKGNELAVFDSFTEYRTLLCMAQEGVWSEREVGKFSEIIGRYTAGYITDRCQQRGDMDFERHPAGLRLMAHFLRREDLPEELYRIAWEKLDLKTAVMGRAKILYGPMRERVLEQVPELAGAQKTNYFQLRTEVREYMVRTYKRNGERAEATAEDVGRTEALFAREDFRNALLDRRIVEEDLLHTWVDPTCCDVYLQKIIQFYTEHESAPCAQKVVERAREALKRQKLAERLRRDREAVPSGCGLTLKSGAFFRHWLNTGFYQARDPESGIRLLDWRNRELPYLPEWSTAFLGASEEGIVPKVLTFSVGGDTLEVRFHLRYMEFWRNQVPVYRPCLAWERALEFRDTDLFFYFLPITVATWDRFPEVKEEIRRRLEDTAAPEDGRAFLAGCLAERVCSLPLPGEAGQVWDADEDEEEPSSRDLPPESALPFELFAEDFYHLYGCEWNQRGKVLMVFEQQPTGRKLFKNGFVYDVDTEEEAAARAKQLLEEILTPPPIPVEQLAVLPDAVYVQPDFNVLCRAKDVPFAWKQPVELSGEAVTREVLEDLLERFARDYIQRLELTWETVPPPGEGPDWTGQRSLVVLKSGRSYACLYFDDSQAKSFALLERPERYGKTDSEAHPVDFRQGKLFRDVVHQSFSSIRRQLDVIFQQVSWPNGVHDMAGGIWIKAVNVAEGRSKYYLDKQLLGGFPLERAHGRSDAPVYFLHYPTLAVRTDEQGAEERLTLDERNRGRFQEMLAEFLGGGWPKLRMTWGEEAGQRRHIVLLQDGGRFLMAWIEEADHRARYHVADVGTYMDVEGKKYPKGTFQGKVTPAYLIHDGIVPLRGALELLLANLDHTAPITNKIAEYAEEKPVKARTYEAIWSDLVGEA